MVDLRSDYDLIDKQVTEYLAWQDTDEGKKVGAPRINENHKEMLFNKWDEQIRGAEQVAEGVATAASRLIDCVLRERAFQFPFLPLFSYYCFMLWAIKYI